MRKYLALLLALVSVFTLSITALADWETDPPVYPDPNYPAVQAQEPVLATGGVTVTLEGTTLTISGTGMVTQADLADVDKNSVTKAVLEEGITGIDDSAFWGFSNMTEISLPDTLVHLGYSAFSGCPITSLVLPDLLQTIDKYDLNGCTNLRSLTFGANTTIHGYSDIQLGSLEEILVPDNHVAYVSVDGVLYNKDMTQLVWYPAGKADTTYTVPSTVTSIVIYAFQFSRHLTSVTLPEGLRSISMRAFADAVQLRSINLPGSLRTIDNEAFAGTALTSITIPAATTSIGDGPFAYCSALTNITVESGNPNYRDVDGVLFGIDSESGAAQTLICYPAGKNPTAYTIPAEITAIAPDAFSGCTNLSDLSLAAGSKLRSVGSHALDSTPWFQNNYDEFVLLGSCLVGYNGYDTIVTIPDGVTSISNAVFQRNWSITGVVMPDSVTYIDDRSFENCGCLVWENCRLSENLTYIGDWAFSGTPLTSITLPDSVTYIGDFAFMSCSDLTQITLGSRLTSIGQQAFSFCDQLTSITLPDSVTYTDHSVFMGCTGLTSATLSKNLTFISSWLFEDCSALTSITIPEGVTNIGSSAFINCVSLTNVSIPSTVTDIYGNAFSNCTSLTDVHFGGSRAQWDKIRISNGNSALLEATLHCYGTDDGGDATVLNGLVMDANGIWWYYIDNVLQTNYTGLVYQSGTFFYVENGAVNTGYTGLVLYYDVWYYVENGVLNFSYTGLVYFNDAFFYVEGGVLNAGYMGLVEFAGGWYYAQGGVLDWSYTGLIYQNGAFFYVVNGVLDAGFTGLVEFYGAWYYIEGGVLNFAYTGLIYQSGAFFYVVNGVLDAGFTGLVEFYGAWYYVEYGVLNFDYVGLVYANGVYFYVRGGVIDLTYSGPAYAPDGTLYDVIGGIVQP